jgi:hypothetical protein
MISAEVRWFWARRTPAGLGRWFRTATRDGQWPTRGCGVELTRIAVAGERWWSLGFEAFGHLESVAADLRAVARLMARRRPPSLAGGRLLSYPWLDARGVDC